jgi:hypothetical protein
MLLESKDVSVADKPVLTPLVAFFFNAPLLFNPSSEPT